MVTVACGLLPWELETERKIKTKNPELIDTENRLMVARGRRVGRWSKWVQGVKMYKLPIQWRYNVQHDDYS